MVDAGEIEESVLLVQTLENLPAVRTEEEEKAEAAEVVQLDVAAEEEEKAEAAEVVQPDVAVANNEISEVGSAENVGDAAEKTNVAEVVQPDAAVDQNEMSEVGSAENVGDAAEKTNVAEVVRPDAAVDQNEMSEVGPATEVSEAAEKTDVAEVFQPDAAVAENGPSEVGHATNASDACPDTLAKGDIDLPRLPVLAATSGEVCCTHSPDVIAKAPRSSDRDLSLAGVPNGYNLKSLVQKPFCPHFGLGTLEAEQLQRDVINTLLSVGRVGIGDLRNINNIGKRFNQLFWRKDKVKNGSWKSWLQTLPEVKVDLEAKPYPGAVYLCTNDVHGDTTVAPAAHAAHAALADVQRASDDALAAITTMPGAQHTSSVAPAAPKEEVQGDNVSRLQADVVSFLSNKEPIMLSKVGDAFCARYKALKIKDKFSVWMSSLSNVEVVDGMASLLENGATYEKIRVLDRDVLQFLQRKAPLKIKKVGAQFASRYKALKLEGKFSQYLSRLAGVRVANDVVTYGQGKTFELRDRSRSRRKRARSPRERMRERSRSKRKRRGKSEKRSGSRRKRSRSSRKRRRSSRRSRSRRKRSADRKKSSKKRAKSRKRHRSSSSTASTRSTDTSVSQPDGSAVDEPSVCLANMLPDIDDLTTCSLQVPDAPGRTANEVQNWFVEANADTGILLQYMEPLLNEFDSLHEVVAAVNEARPGASIIDRVEPMVYQACGLSKGRACG
eukprot:TRINITY_DN25331_c0_g1_i3.p1 TRINITY_DN25331_c0_g1~~TRINITY_DN25331_c0_g1_i3.p1  ORF type:complete len:725 (-),score=91.63 TRINITY_DN25331_c0_g1_i3:152-2326(-)